MGGANNYSWINVVRSGNGGKWKIGRKLSEKHKVKRSKKAIVWSSFYQLQHDVIAFQIPSIKTICADLVNLDETIKAVEAAGHIDLLVNNAALVDVGSAMDVTKERMEKQVLQTVHKIECHVGRFFTKEDNFFLT